MPYLQALASGAWSVEQNLPVDILIHENKTSIITGHTHTLRMFSYLFLSCRVGCDGPFPEQIGKFPV